MAVPTSRDVAAHYGGQPLRDLLLGALQDAGLDTSGKEPLDPDQLAPLDQLHAGGRGATAALAEQASVTAATRVLDVGAGLGGPARMLASRCGCPVTCLDLTPEFCDAARLLTELTGLPHLVSVHQGDAQQLPFADGSFDLVWMQNVSLNVPDKSRLYGEVRRVLAPGGRLAAQEVLATDAGLPVCFPTVWAADASTGALVTEAELRRVLATCGLRIDHWLDTTQWTLDQPPPPEQPVLGPHVYIRDLPTKQANDQRNLREGRVRLVRTVARAGPDAAAD